MPELRANVVLASASPRRRELLALVGIDVAVAPVDADERVRAGESPEAYVVRVAREKLELALGRHEAGTAVVAADTTVRIDGVVLGKPADDAEAHATLRRLAGRAHEVTTAVSVGLAGTDRRAHVAVTTTVRFRELDDRTIERYVALGEGRDKAGGYAIQGVGSGFVSAIEGSYANVVGLPVVETLALLGELGVLASWP